MIITKENIDDLNAVLNIQIEKNDYADKVESVLKNNRKKANIKGFAGNGADRCHQENVRKGCQDRGN